MKVKMLIARGIPTNGGAILSRGATVELPEFWAERFINDGSAVLVDKEEKPKKDKSKDK